MPIEKTDLLILTTLALEPQHGFGIGQRIEQMSGGEFRITLGTLYPALQRLEQSGHVKAEWTTSDNNRRARYYRLTAAGRRKAVRSRQSFERTVSAMMRVLNEAARRVWTRLRELKVKRFVVGHTIHTGGIGRRFGDRVFLIDTGMNTAYAPNGRASALNIENGIVSTIYADTARQR